MCNRNSLITVWTNGNHLTGEGTHISIHARTGKWKFMLALSWKIFVTVSRLGAIWLDVTRKGKSRKPADQWKHRNKDTVPKNMLQFGWPNVCSVCMSQIQNKFSNFMNNSTESNWSGHCNTQLKIDTQDRLFFLPMEHELLHNGYYCTHNHCLQHCVIT